MANDILKRLDAAYARSSNPDTIVLSAFGNNGWVQGKDFTDEMCFEWQDQHCVVWNGAALDQKPSAHWTFWFARDREWLRSACGHMWFCRITDYFEGSLPPCTT